MKRSQMGLMVVAGLLAAFALGLAARGVLPARQGAAAGPAGPRVEGPPATAPVRTAPPRPATVPTTLPAEEEPWREVVEQLGRGVASGEVYTVTVARSDLEVGHIELGPLPVEAGLESRLHFFICPCGKAAVVGELCVADYEVNDVIDELRSAAMKVASVSPMFIGEKPKVMSLRFQGEGSLHELASGLKKALGWTGEGRNQVQ